MAFKKQKRVHFEEPQKMAGGPLEDNRNYHPEKPEKTKKKKTK